MLLGVLATTFSAIGLSRALHGAAFNRAAAITGLALGILCILLGLIIWITEVTS
jgi:multisubunit Na+/H+ antiporter MnhG subunit